MKYEIGKRYFFWDKRRRKVSYLEILDLFGSYFVFSYYGKTFSCEYSYAQFKLFEYPSEVVEARKRTKENELENPLYWEFYK